MDFTKFGLMVLALSGALASIACAQSTTAPDYDYAKAPPTDYGAGYKVIMVNQHQEHEVAPRFDDGGQNPVRLALSYPLIAAPLTPDTSAYNAAIKALIPRWWKDIGGPADNSQAADPGTDYSLVCTPGAGVGNEVGPPLERMLPGVISMSCSSYVFPHGNAHGGGNYWGFNWLVPQHRPVQPEDIFTPNSGWLKALTALANAARGTNLPAGMPKLDYADRHRWVLGADGLGLNFSTSEFFGFSNGGGGSVTLIGWSQLARYLRKGGIVPPTDWSAAGVSDLFPNLSQP